jgi:selenocysteine-specific elongation factor
VILGTAGHIDHGKTTLVRALTGVDTDRLPEEKRRGITIDLGFAPLVLDGVGTIGVVDVPGHEAFVRTMVAGATGVDLALLVIAADEGVMPQTREHLAILELLGVTTGVVALTKADLVEPEWLALVTEEVRDVLASGPLRDVAIVPVSSRTGVGLDALRDALSAAARALPVRTTDDLFRMPVDRAFVVRGTGTVVTGTVWSGTLRRDESLRLFPGETSVRVRGLQAHGRSVESVHAGERAAVALANVSVDEVHRGAVLVSGSAWRASRILRADVELLADAPRALGSRSRVRLHLGTSDVDARIVVPGGALVPGARLSARVVVDEAITARTGDRFVLRLLSPATTIGGGVVTDPLAPPRARAWPEGVRSAAALLSLALEDAGIEGVALDQLPIRLGIPPSAAAALLREEELWRVADRVLSLHARDGLSQRLLELVDEHHAGMPLDAGAPVQWLRSGLRAPEAVLDAAIDLLAQGGVLAANKGVIRRPSHAPRMSSLQQAVAGALVANLTAAGAEPPSIEELASEMRVAPGELETIARAVARSGAVVAVAPGRYYDVGVVTHLTGLLCAAIPPGAALGPSDLRGVLGLTRKFLIPFLEYCDREGYTIRDELGRRRRGNQ